MKAAVLQFLRAAIGHQRIGDTSPMGVEATSFANNLEAMLKRMRQHEQDAAWRVVDSCGGTYTPEDEASGYAKGHRAALDAVCAELERAGARDPDFRVARMALALDHARTVFTFYAEGHAMKHPPDRIKEQRNREMANACMEALG